MSIPNLRAIRDWCKEKIKGIEDSLVINGVRYYLDYQNGKYGVNTDPGRGADTFDPFRQESEGGGDGGNGGVVKQIIDFSYSGCLSKYNYSNFIYKFGYFDINKLTKLILNKYYLECGNYSGTTASTFYLNLNVIAGGTSKSIRLYSKGISSTSQSVLVDVSDIEYTLDSLKELAGGEIEEIRGFTIAMTGSSSSYAVKVTDLLLNAEVQYTS